MKKIFSLFVLLITILSGTSAFSAGIQTEQLLRAVSNAVSGERAREYTARLWLHDRWSTWPQFKQSAREAAQIIKDRGFNVAEVVDVPADGITKFGDWTSPISWDCKQATLEVLEPKILQDNIRYLCDYQKNPTSISMWSKPTPPEGLEAELFLLESVDPKQLAEAKGKIILTDERAGGVGLNRLVQKFGIAGIVTDYIEDENLVTANQWENQMSDIPLGWGHTQKDSRQFIFSISPEKGRYLRNLLRKGEKVIVRAKIDSRLYTDDTLPYVTGALLGNGAEGEEILVAGHIYEFGANDNSTGAASAIEAIGALNELIKDGILPKTKRTIRVWFGFEMYGSLPFVVQNLGRLQKKTIAALALDTGAPDYEITRTRVMLNSNFTPSFTDALLCEIVRTYYEKLARLTWTISPFSMGTDTYFCEPMLGIPTNGLGRSGGPRYHHSSFDTIDKVDPRSLRDLSILEAVYLYYLANVGIDDAPKLAELTFERASEVLLDKTLTIKNSINQAQNGAELGEIQRQEIKTIDYYTTLQKDASKSIYKIILPEQRDSIKFNLDHCINDIETLSKMCIRQIDDAVKDKAQRENLAVIPPAQINGIWEQEAATIIPKRTIVATITLEGIPFEEWEEVSMSPRFYGQTNWASASYWCCDGKRNLLQIKEIMELDAGQPVRNFDLIKYYKFLKRHNLIEFVEK